MLALPYISDLADSHALLLARVAGLTDDDVKQPTALPGWTRDMLLAHLHFGAEGMLGATDAAISGELAVMYPGGAAQRGDDIASGSGRALALGRLTVKDLRASGDRQLAQQLKAAFPGP